VGSYEPTGIDVLIIGTGLAGLVAALECVRKGHNVRVLERNENINTAGKRRILGRKTPSDMMHRRHVLHGTERYSFYEALA
jgi:monoamine oxidase